jgi:hypothetical protein
MGAALAAEVAQNTCLSLDRDLLIALADFASHRRGHHVVRSIDRLESDVWRELDRLEFAIPGSTAEARSRLLLAHRWSHKSAIQAEIKRLLSSEAREVFSSFAESKYNHIITRAFAASKKAPHPVHACVTLLEEQAVLIGRKREATNVLDVGVRSSRGGGGGLPSNRPRSKLKAQRGRIRKPTRSR